MSDGQSKPILAYQGIPMKVGGGNPPSGTEMEARVAKLEAAVEHIQSDIKDIKADLREIKRDAREDFRLLFGALIVLGLGLAGILAKGFHWL